MSENKIGSCPGKFPRRRVADKGQKIWLWVWHRGYGAKERTG